VRGILSTDVKQPPHRPSQYPLSKQLCCSLQRPVHLQIRGHLQQAGGQQPYRNVQSRPARYSLRNDRWIVVTIDSPRPTPSLELLSFSAATQINENELLVFGGYDNSDLERPERLCYALSGKRGDRQPTSSNTQLQSATTTLLPSPTQRASGTTTPSSTADASSPFRISPTSRTNSLHSPTNVE
jgi:hypothetical protein